MTAAESDPEGERQTQLLRGALDMCLLALLAQQPGHGYELVHRLAAAGFPTVGYGTIYPLLTRLRRLDLVTHVSQASPDGPPRKVYALTDAGRTRLRDWGRQWHQFADAVDTLVTDVAAPSPRS